MKNAECIAFLHEVLPRLRMRWAGFRKVRKQVCKRISRRLGELGIADLEAYSRYLRDHASEWDVLYRLCRVTISRFYRDRGVFDSIRTEVLPAIAAAARAGGETDVRVWSAGCASGEETYTLQIVWKLCVAPSSHGVPPLCVIATDADPHLVARAQKGLYQASAMKDLPGELASRAFDQTTGGYVIRETFKKDILFAEQDIREQLPGGSFHLILCRNLVFTYFDEALQRELATGIIERLEPGGFLVIGAHEKLPARMMHEVEPHTAPCIYRKIERRHAPSSSGGRG